jgi:SAM-dependent methyltransferase
MSGSDPAAFSAEFKGWCGTCGHEGIFKQAHRSARETFTCDVCRSSARYQVQAEAIVQSVTGRPDMSLRSAAEEGLFSRLRIYEVGVTGPFRRIFGQLPNYTTSFYWDDVPKGKQRDGVTCQDLMALTYENGIFDLVITSDIMEHVRRPEKAFAEIRRILVPGGKHVFTVPTNLPFTRPTIRRVDTSGPEDVYLLPPTYHGDGKGGKSLVYNEFGADLIEMLGDLGLQTRVFPHPAGGDVAARCLAFVSTAVTRASR